MMHLPWSVLLRGNVQGRGCTGDVQLPLQAGVKFLLNFMGIKVQILKKTQSEFVFSAQLLLTSPVSRKFCCVLFQLMLVEPGLQRALRTELVGLMCFPSHLLRAQQCLHNQIISCQGKLGCGENKNST